MVKSMVDLHIELEINCNESLTVEIADAVTIEGFEIVHPVPIIPSNYGLITYNGSIITVS